MLPRRTARLYGRHMAQNRRRDERWQEYSRRKNEWILGNPEAMQAEIERAAQAIARDLGL